MSRVKERFVIDVETHESSAQVFTLQEGTIYGVPTMFEVAERITISRDKANYGAPIKAPAVKRIQIQTKGVRLDSATIEQFSIASGRIMQEKDLFMLKGANILYYISDRIEGESFYHSPSTKVPRLAPRTGEFTSLFGVEVADRFEDLFQALPKHNRKVEQSDEDAKAIEAEATTIQTEYKSAMDAAAAKAKADEKAAKGSS